MPRLLREESREATRQRLLAAARETFAKFGFVGASVDQVAQAAGFSKGAVYSNFASKEALFLELLRQHMAEEIGELQALLRTSSSARAILRSLEEKYSRPEKQEVWCLLSAEFQLHAGRSPQFAKPFAALYRKQRKAVGRLVGLIAIKSGGAAPAAAQLDEIATSLMAVILGIALQRGADPGAVSAATAGRSLRLLLASFLRTGTVKPPKRKVRTRHAL